MCRSGGWSNNNTKNASNNNDDGWDDEPSTTNKSNGKRLSNWNDERPNKLSRSDGKDPLKEMGANILFKLCE